MSTFEIIDGKLHHFINGELRAVIENANVEAYREFFPEAPQAAIEGEAVEVTEPKPESLLSRLGLVPSDNPMANG